MKNIKLTNLTLKNFKGIKSLELDASGNDLKVYGDNATGKTSIFDGFLWLLFNKDSNNRSDFSIKTLDSGKEINNLEHEVSALFTVDGVPLSLRKVYQEEWKKKRGAPIAEFTGHKTDYAIDGVPVKKKEYEEKVGSIVKEEVFKLLTNPLYFNEQVKWQDRRETLLEVCGDVELEDVLAFNNELKELPAILKGRAIEDHRKMIAARKTEINKELERIPVRIDELNNSMPEDTINVSSIEVEIAEVEKEIDASSAQINNIKNGSAITAKQNDLRQLEMDLESIKRELESDATEQGYKVQARIQEEQSNISIMQRKADDAKHQVAILQKDVQRLDEKMSELRDQYYKEEALTFEHTEECECPTCGQSLPEEEVIAARVEAEKRFNIKKSNELERINLTGKTFKDDKGRLLEKIEQLEKQTPAHAEEIQAKEKLVKKLNDELNQLRGSIQDARQDAKYTDKQQEIQKVKDEIESLKSSADEAVSAIEKEVAELKDKRSELNARIAQHSQAEASKKRIVELEGQQAELAKEFENIEKELYLTESFIRSKVELLESKINSKFKYARFKLFETQINGGLKEVCETTYEGVPYSSGLNNAARINVGIDIINTLTEHFGIRAPIFVDNAEAVTRIADTDSQLISLVVSEKDKQLRIESQSEDMKEAI
ncbi:gp49 family protein [Sporosarcina newyorkensis 2681]|uniref:Nuclease SbcCD subunit C n=1 Tax=Sporosarcina newyorkensis 2681 TaxID=1027292 RepID=F9DX66_9BACL|nr:AAA family ATPase [Sporosarcina newyorkensis]EGQ21114.1 gp49 family protein [Sporosarcina newyorkensis 2681]